MNVVNGVEQLLQRMVMPELEAIRKSLIPRIDRLESDVREHTGQIRELYSLNAAVQARLDHLEKKSS